MEPLEPEIFQNGIWYELRGEQYYPCLLPPEPDHTEGELLETIIRQMAKAQGIDEELKERDPLAWVGAMNNIKSAAQEFFGGKRDGGVRLHDGPLVPILSNVVRG